jgi:SAM-dependent methyltransferase
MHPSSLELGKLFFERYCSRENIKIVVDIGSQNVNGSLKDVCPQGIKYVGVDFVAASGVDVVLTDPYKLPFEDCSVDAVVCSSVFEHSQFFWLLYLEVLRVLKPHGLFYMNAPSNGYIHRYPVDCWRFYPDAGFALVEWGKRHGHSVALLESFIAAKNYVSVDRDAWNDFVAVFVKDKNYCDEYPHQIMSGYRGFSNGFMHGKPGEELNPSELTDDFLIIKQLTDVIEKGRQEYSAINQQYSDVRERYSEVKERLARAEADLSGIKSSRGWRYLARLRQLRAQIRSYL